MNTEPENTTTEIPAGCADLAAIAARAYAIWQEQGQPDGRDFDHWVEAEAHFLACRDDDAAKQNGTES